MAYGSHPMLPAPVLRTDSTPPPSTWNRADESDDDGYMNFAYAAAASTRLHETVGTADEDQRARIARGRERVEWGAARQRL